MLLIWRRHRLEECLFPTTYSKGGCWCLLPCAAYQPLAPPFQLFAPYFCLFLFERAGSRNTSTSDQLVVNEVQYFSFKKLRRGSHKARIWLSFRKPGYRKPPLRSFYWYLGYFFPLFGRRLQHQKVSIYSLYWAKNIPGTNLLLLIGLGL